MQMQTCLDLKTTLPFSMTVNQAGTSSDNSSLCVLGYAPYPPGASGSLCQKFKTISNGYLKGHVEKNYKAMSGLRTKEGWD